MKFTIETDDIDWPLLEQVIARIVTRTARTLAANGLLPWKALTPRNAPIEEVQTEAPAAPVVVKPPLQPAPEPTADTPVTQLPLGANSTKVNKPPREKTGKKLHPLRDMCPVVATRPEGFADVNHVLAAIGGGPNEQSQIYQWIGKGEVHAIVVANAKPPTKGMPGRIMVNTREIIARNELRIHNSTQPAKLRRQAPIVAHPKARPAATIAAHSNGAAIAAE